MVVCDCRAAGLYVSCWAVWTVVLSSTNTKEAKFSQRCLHPLSYEVTRTATGVLSASAVAVAPSCVTAPACSSASRLSAMSRRSAASLRSSSSRSSSASSSSRLCGRGATEAQRAIGGGRFAHLRVGCAPSPLLQLVATRLGSHKDPPHLLLHRPLPADGTLAPLPPLAWRLPAPPQLGHDAREPKQVAARQRARLRAPR